MKVLVFPKEHVVQPPPNPVQPTPMWMWIDNVFAAVFCCEILLLIASIPFRHLLLYAMYVLIGGVALCLPALAIAMFAE